MYIQNVTVSQCTNELNFIHTNKKKCLFPVPIVTKLKILSNITFRSDTPNFTHTE